LRDVHVRHVSSCMSSNVCILLRPVQLHTVGRCKGLKVVKLSSKQGTSYSLVQTLLLWDVSLSHNAQRHRQTDRRAVRSAKMHFKRNLLMHVQY